MEVTNKALRDLIIAHRSDPTLQLNPLSLKINGIVDAAVMGGVTNYEKVSSFGTCDAYVFFTCFKFGFTESEDCGVTYLCVTCRNSASVVLWIHRLLSAFPVV
jgi:hypothetical protein